MTEFGQAYGRKVLPDTISQLVAMAAGLYSVEAEVMKERRFPVTSRNETIKLPMAMNRMPAPLVEMC